MYPQSVYIPSINSVVYICIHAHFLMSQWKNLNLLKVPSLMIETSVWELNLSDPSVLFIIN